MKEMYMNNNLNDKVDSIIKQAMHIYVNRLITGYYEIGLEATFQLHFSKILQDLLDINTFSSKERFEVLLEKNIKVNGNKDYVDVVIRHTEDTIISLYLIELKYKKISDSASDLGNVASYIDMYNLDSHKNTENVKGCYFIFMTNLKTYISKPRKGARIELPMYDLAKIEPNHAYTFDGKTAKNAIKKYAPNGFQFSISHSIEYEHFRIDTNDYWFFIEKM